MTVASPAYFEIIDFIEAAELDHFMVLEHILRMAKAKARQVLARGQ